MGGKKGNLVKTGISPSFCYSGVTSILPSLESALFAYALDNLRGGIVTIETLQILPPLNCQLVVRFEWIVPLSWVVCRFSLTEITTFLVSRGGSTHDADIPG